jgi:hypothetical protein
MALEQYGRQNLDTLTGVLTLLKSAPARVPPPMAMLLADTGQNPEESLRTTDEGFLDQKHILSTTNPSTLWIQDMLLQTFFTAKEAIMELLLQA